MLYFLEVMILASLVLKELPAYCWIRMKKILPKYGSLLLAGFEGWFTLNKEEVKTGKIT